MPPSPIGPQGSSPALQHDGSCRCSRRLMITRYASSTLDRNESIPFFDNARAIGATVNRRAISSTCTAWRECTAPGAAGGRVPCAGASRAGRRVPQPARMPDFGGAPGAPLPSGERRTLRHRASPRPRGWLGRSSTAPALVAPGSADSARHASRRSGKRRAGEAGRPTPSRLRPAGDQSSLRSGTRSSKRGVRFSWRACNASVRSAAWNIPVCQVAT